MIKILVNIVRDETFDHKKQNYGKVYLLYK